MGHVWRLKATRHASVSESGRHLHATHRLERATRRSPAGDLDFESAQTDPLSKDRRIVNASCRRQSRECEIEAGGHERVSSDHAR
jgi:hypothetical protein